MSYSTEDCKKYLITIYTDTEEKGWKRVKKYNNENNIVARDFEYKDGRKATVLELPEGLKDQSLLKQNPIIKKSKSDSSPAPDFNPFAQIRNNSSDHKSNNTNPEKKEKEDFQNFMNKVLNGNPPEISNTPKSSIDMLKDFLKEQDERNNQVKNGNDFFDLSGMPDIFVQAIHDNDRPLNPLVRAKENLITLLFENVSFKNLDTSEEKFLYVLVNGTQWEESDGNKASTDFFKNIRNNTVFFDNLIKREVDLPNMYLLHIINTAAMIEAMDEGYIPFHVMEGEEALSSMRLILQDILNIYEKDGKKIEFEKDLVEGCTYTLEILKELCSMNDAGDLWEKEDIDNELDKLIGLIKSKAPKKRIKAMNFIVREALSKELYQLFKKGEARFLCQVPFVDKEGNSLPDEDAEYMNITQAVKEMLEAGASPLYYIKDTENFLLPTILNEMRGSSAFSEEVKKEITDLLLNSMNTKELNGLLPTHANMLMKQMLYYDDELNQLFLKGLEFKQDIDNHYADESMEIAAIRKGQTDFFLKLAQNSVTLDFEKIYHEGSYNETSLIIEVNKLKEKISKFKLDSAEDNQVYETQKNENRKETVTLLEKWILKNKVESMNKSSKIKEGKLKL